MGTPAAKHDLRLRACFARACLGECSSLDSLCTLLATEAYSIRSSVATLIESAAAATLPESHRAWLICSDIPCHTHDTTFVQKQHQWSSPVLQQPGQPGRRVQEGAVVRGAVRHGLGGDAAQGAAAGAIAGGPAHKVRNAA